MSAAPFTRFHLRYKWRISLIILAFVMAISLLTIGTGRGVAAPNQQGALHRVYVSDVRDGQFVVSWTTDTPSDGRVEWGTTTMLGSIISDGVSSTTTHYVVITGLVPNTRYYFQVRSGALLDNNHGSYYTVTTGATLGIPGSGKFVFGYVNQPGGTSPVSNAIVYLQLQDADGLGSAGSSQLVTARTAPTGGWFYSNLYDIRTATAGAFFNFSDGADRLNLMVQGGSQGTATTVVTVPVAYPAQLANLVVDATPNAVTLAKFNAASYPNLTGVPLILIAVLGAVGVLVWQLKKRKVHV